jgi:hypothetical protein
LIDKRARVAAVIGGRQAQHFTVRKIAPKILAGKHLRSFHTFVRYVWVERKLPNFVLEGDLAGIAFG